MAIMGEAHALAFSIGEHLVSALNSEGLFRGLSLVLDEREMHAHVWVELPASELDVSVETDEPMRLHSELGWSDAAQLEALRLFGEVEVMFADEAVMTFQFVVSLDDVEAQRPAVPAFSQVAA